MAVPTSISDCNATASNNSPAGSDSIGTSLDDYLRSHAAIIRQVYDALVIVDGTLLPKAGGTVTGQIKGITPVAAEDLTRKDYCDNKLLKSGGVMTGQLTVSGGQKLKIGSSATSSQNFLISTPTPEDGTLTLEREDGTDVMTVSAAGVINFPSGIANTGTESKNATGNVLVDFTIPAGVKKATVRLSTVSMSGSSPIIIQLGDSGGVETTSYAAVAQNFINNATPGAASAVEAEGFLINTTNALSTITGVANIHRADPTLNLFFCDLNMYNGYSGSILTGSGVKSISGDMTTIRVTMKNGTDSFDSGDITVDWEK